MSALVITIFISVPTKRFGRLLPNTIGIFALASELVY